MNLTGNSAVLTERSAPPGLRIRAGRLVFRGEDLFHDLDVDLRSGAITALLGPSGVGKSSLLRLVAGLVPAEPPTTVLCDDGMPADGRVAWMDQRDLLLPWLTVEANVTLGARLRGEAAADARAKGLLRQVGLLDRAADLPATLSGGMRQRVALARTLYENRPIVLMDEPFAALDALTRHRLQGLAAELLRGRTVLLVTHDPLEALRVADRIHVMAGRPARLDAALAVPGGAPRDPTDPAILPLYRELMRRLASAAEMQS